MTRPSSHILEHNLERLLTRAYQPVCMRDAFRAELAERVLRACGERRSPRAARPRAFPRALPLAGTLAAAAALLLVALQLLRLWAGTTPDGVHAPLEEVLARAGVALRDGPQASWRAANAVELESGVALVRPWLEVRTGEARTVSLTARGGSSLALGPRSGVLVEDGDAAAGSATLFAGELSAHLDPEQRWRVRAAESELVARGGDLTVALLDPLERATLAERVPEIAADRALARVHHSGGELAVPGTSLRGTGPELHAPPTSEHDGYVQAGQWIAVAGTSETTSPGSERSALDPPPAPPVESAPQPWQLDGTLSLPAGTALPERYQVWLRPLVSLPKVSVAERHDFDGTQASFHMEGTTGGPHLVQVEALGFAPWKSGEIELVPGLAIDLDVRLGSGASVEGFVIDGPGGAPVAGALVVAERDVPHEVLALDGSWQGEPSLPDELPLACTRTDAHGAFTLSYLTPGDHVLRATAPGFSAAWVQCAALRAGVREQVGDLVLGGGARLHGTVHREDGSAWADAEIIAARIEIMSSSPCISYGFARADAFGTYVIEHLPAGFYVVMNESQQPNAEPDWQRLEQVVLREGDDRVLDFRAGSSTRTVRGNMHDASGAPVRDATLYLSADLSGEVWRGWSATTTADDGAFQFQDVLPGRYGVYQSDGFSTGLHLLALVDVDRAPVVELDITTNPTLLTGVLRAARDGAPLERGVLVLLRRTSERHDWHFAGKLETGATGRFTIEGLPDGEYTVLGIDASEHCAQARFGPYFLQAHAPLELDLALEPGGPVEVRVVDASGVPSAGVRVWAERDGEGAEFYDPSERSAEEGTIRLGALLPGRWTLRAEQVNGPHASLEVDVLEGESHRFEIVLPAR